MATRIQRTYSLTMNITHLYSRPSNSYSTTTGDDLVWNDPFNSPTHVTINGLGGEDVLAFTYSRDRYTNLTISTEADGSTRVTGVLSFGSSGFGFETKQYIDTSLFNFEKIRFPSVKGGGFDYVELSSPNALPSSNAMRGTSANDTLPGTGGNDDIDGNDGIDTVVYSGNRSGFDLAHLSSGYRLSRGSADVDTLAHVERIHFSDIKIALDLTPDGNAGKAMSFIGAIAPSLLNLPSVRGLIISLFDQGLNMENLCSLALDRGLVPNGSSHQLVSAIFANVTGGATAPPQVLESLVEYIGNHSASNFIATVASMHINVDLVGLQSTGLEYSV